MKKFFKKRSNKSGYSNITEPISDLDPKRRALIKSKHVSDLDPKVISAIKAKHAESSKSVQGNSDTTVSLTPSTSQSSKFLRKDSDMHSAGTPETVTSGNTFKSSVRKELFGPSSDSTSKDSLSVTKSKSVAQSSNISTTQASTSRPIPVSSPKTPDTFFQGKNRKRITTYEDDTESPVNFFSSSQADPQPQELKEQPGTKTPEVKSGKKDLPVQQHHITVETTPGPENKEPALNDAVVQHIDRQDSSSSDLDKTFDPEIISINSDITDPTFTPNKSKSKRAGKPRQSWQHLRENLRDTCRQSDFKSPLSFLEMIMDSLCSGPK